MRPAKAGMPPSRPAQNSNFDVAQPSPACAQSTHEPAVDSAATRAAQSAVPGAAVPAQPASPNLPEPPLGEYSARVGTPTLTLRHATVAWRLADDSCWPWGEVAKAVTSMLLAQLGNTGFSPGWQHNQDRKRPKGVAGAAVCPEHTRFEESK